MKPANLFLTIALTAIGVTAPLAIIGIILILTTDKPPPPALTISILAGNLITAPSALAFYAATRQNQ